MSMRTERGAARGRAGGGRFECASLIANLKGDAVPLPCRAVATGRPGARDGRGREADVDVEPSRTAPVHALPKVAARGPGRPGPNGLGEPPET